MTLLELICLAISAYFAYLYVTTKFWFVNNVFAICFTVYCIENWLVGNFRNILLIFIGLVIYDFSFVFHTDVMMTVAQGLDLPIKFLIPQNPKLSSFAMIGLGDIVIPGLFSSMCIRCDLINAFKISKAKAQKDGVKDKSKLLEMISTEISCFYFYASLIGYFIGLAVTFCALHLLQSS